MIQITEEEYNELLEVKQAFLDMCQIKKKAGTAYNNYARLKDMDAFFTKRYGEVYREMKKNYANSCKPL